MIYSIVMTPAAKQMLAEIGDVRIQQKIAEVIDRLKKDPEKQGKALTGELLGFRSIRAAGQRFRVIYKVEEQRVLVIVLAVGLRREGDKRDIYQRIHKLIRLRLLI